MKPNKGIDLKSEINDLSEIVEQLLVDVIPSGQQPVKIPRRRLQAINLLAEAGGLVQAAVINLTYEHVVTEGES